MTQVLPPLLLLVLLWTLYWGFVRRTRAFRRTGDPGGAFGDPSAVEAQAARVPGAPSGTGTGDTPPLTGWRRLKEWIEIVLVVELVTLGSWRFVFRNEWPSTREGWIALLLLGPPLYFLSEMVSEWLFSRLFSWIDRVSGDPLEEPFSGRRIVVALVIFFAFLAVLASFLWMIGAIPGGADRGV